MRGHHSGLMYIPCSFLAVDISEIYNFGICLNLAVYEMNTTSLSKEHNEEQVNIRLCYIFHIVIM